MEATSMNEMIQQSWALLIWVDYQDKLCRKTAKVTLLSFLAGWWDKTNEHQLTIVWILCSYGREAFPYYPIVIMKFLFRGYEPFTIAWMTSQVNPLSI